MTLKLDPGVFKLRAHGVPCECIQALVDLLMKIGVGGNWTEDDSKVDMNCMADCTERMHSGKQGRVLESDPVPVSSAAGLQPSLLRPVSLPITRRLANSKTHLKALKLKVSTV